MLIEKLNQWCSSFYQTVILVQKINLIQSLCPAKMQNNTLFKLCQPWRWWHLFLQGSMRVGSWCKNIVISCDWLPLISAQAAELVTAAMRGHENWLLWGLSASYLSLKANKIVNKAITAEFCSRQSFHGAFFLQSYWIWWNSSLSGFCCRSRALFVCCHAEKPRQFSLWLQEVMEIRGASAAESAPDPPSSSTTAPLPSLPGTQHRARPPGPSRGMPGILSTHLLIALHVLALMGM